MVADPARSRQPTASMPPSCRLPIRAIAEAERLAAAEPNRAEAWFYLGAAYGVRAQFRVYRVERLAAARDGKRIKEALEKALALDPAMHDAEFGIGMYRYYAGVAPAIFRFLRFLLLLPGGDREGGLAQLERASHAGTAGPRRSAVPDPRALPLVRAQVEGGARHHPRPAAALSAQPAVPPDRGGDPRRLLPRSRRQPEGVGATAGARASRAVFRADIAENGRAPQHREAVDRAEGADTPNSISAHARSTRLQKLRSTCRHVFMKVWWMRSIGAFVGPTTNALCLTTDFSHP